MSRKQRWEWQTGELSLSDRRLLQEMRQPLPDEIHICELYEVWIKRLLPSGGKGPAILHLSIKRRDRDVIRDWRELQDIKNDLVGEEYEGVELFPAETRLVDTANQFHLWVIEDRTFRFPFGYTERAVSDAPDPRFPKAVNRPLPKARRE